jgi:hypothetical protein
MDAITQVEDFVLRHPTSADAGVLGQLLRSLQDGLDFDVQKLYGLSLSNFDLAIDMLNAWRLQRYYRGGAIMAGARMLKH